MAAFVEEYPETNCGKVLAIWLDNSLYLSNSSFVKDIFSPVELTPFLNLSYSSAIAGMFCLNWSKVDFSSLWSSICVCKSCDACSKLFLYLSIKTLVPIIAAPARVAFPIVDVNKNFKPFPKALAKPPELLTTVELAPSSPPSMADDVVFSTTSSTPAAFLTISSSTTSKTFSPKAYFFKSFWDISDFLFLFPNNKSVKDFSAISLPIISFALSGITSLSVVNTLPIKPFNPFPFPSPRSLPVKDLRPLLSPVSNISDIMLFIPPSTPFISSFHLNLANI